MKKKYLSVLVILSFVFFVAATSSTAPKPKDDDDDGWQNLKVLPKDMGEKQLDSVMAHFSISLGVRCNFCHAPTADSIKPRHLDFASDKKDEKLRAREMFQMTAYINANFFNDQHSTRPDTIHEVVCYTCHRGSNEPDAKVFLAMIDSTVQAHRNRRPPPPPGAQPPPQPGQQPAPPEKK